MPDNHNSPQRNWARQVSKDFAQTAHDSQKALGYAGHVAGCLLYTSPSPRD